MHVNHNPWSRHRLHRGLCSGQSAQCHQNATLACSRSRGAAMLEPQPFKTNHKWSDNPGKSVINPSYLTSAHRKLVCWQMTQVPLPDGGVRKILFRCAYITEGIKEKTQHHIFSDNLFIIYYSLSCCYYYSVLSQPTIIQSGS